MAETLLAVRADVLDRRRAGRARDAGEALDAREARLDGPAPRRRSTPSPAANSSFVPSSSKPLVAMRRAVPCEALVADDEVAAAADDQQRRAGGVGSAHRVDHLGVGRRG
ncbi:hypothetical protein [Streptomyces sp. KL116D]|uniref:hypothetical protein n=1 Tax=Streptomyces sp. KL116D TaxID=3045152 RepID=UPI003558815B